MNQTVPHYYKRYSKGQMHVEQVELKFV